MERLIVTWSNLQTTAAVLYRCGHCGEQMGSHLAFVSTNPNMWSIRICTVCNRPTYFEQERRFPGVPFGDEVAHLPPDVEAIYQEIRSCMSASAYTAAVLLSRKLLMHIAVSKNANPGEKFAFYVDYLVDNNFAPAGAKEWVKHVKDKGNEANHEITIMGKSDAEGA